jgi:hypothetical protein
MTTMRDEKAIDREITAKGKTGPRLTPEMIDAVIAKRDYLHPEGTTLTICVLTLKNGFTVVGESAAASPENFDAGLGCRIAYDNARAKIWPLEGYLLKQALYVTRDGEAQS